MSAPCCPHGEKLPDDDLGWLCPEFPHGPACCPPEPYNPGNRPTHPEPAHAPAPVRPLRPAGVTRLDWLEALVVRAKARARDQKGMRVLPEHIFYAMVFTEGHFDYATGRGTKHQAPAYAAPRLGVGESTVKRFLEVMEGLGYLARQPGRGRRFGRGGETPLYQLTLPVVHP